MEESGGDAKENGGANNEENKDRKAEDSGPADVAFLYKTMLQRDPSKRRVKPVEQHLMQIHFGMSDDDDTDSDYEFKPGAESEDDVGSDDSAGPFICSDGAKEKDVKHKSSDSDGESGEDSVSSSEIESLQKGPPIAAPKLQFDMKVCCVCLTSSCDEDEIVECDGCGILVHEGCYGTIEEDVLSVHSDMSTESTEPWFCDPCKAGVVPTCELCPNQFGIFKQTDTGRWVHLICALYVPAVAFGNTEKLTNVTLLEMPYTKWGAKECSLCEDENYSYTGVCIGCDAGMCRSFFHVTCAQKQGLLSEAAIDEVGLQEIADPFYAHCRMHGDKLVSKHKKRNFLALNSHVKHFKVTKSNRPVSQRTKRRLEHYKQKFKEAETKRPPAWAPPNKLPRSISSSASAVNSLLRKAELLGVVTGSKTSQRKEVITRKSYVAPALSVDFASYYEQRTSKIEYLKKLNKESKKQGDSLKTQEKNLGEQIEKLRSTIKELHTCHEESRQAGFDIYSALQGMTDSTITIPEVYKATNKLMSPTAIVSRKGVHTNSPCGICNSTKEQHLLAKCDQCSKYYHLYCLDPPLTRMPKKSKLCGWVCSICDHNNHEMPARVDEEVDTDAPRRLRQIVREPDKFFQPELKLFVEKFKRNPANRARKRARAGPKKLPGDPAKSAPPRKSIGPKRRPGARKKSKQINPAVGVVSETSDQVDGQPEEKSLAGQDETADGDGTTTKSSAASDTMETDNHTDDHLSPTADTSHLLSPATTGNPLSPMKLGRKSKMLKTGSCKPCNTDCNGGNAVKCDECLNWYHFSCLNPPVKKSPKPRGYQWYCDDCEKMQEGSPTPTADQEASEVSESLTMEIVQGTGSDEKTVVSFDGDVTTL